MLGLVSPTLPAPLILDVPLGLIRVFFERLHRELHLPFLGGHHSQPVANREFRADLLIMSEGCVFTLSRRHWRYASAGGCQRVPARRAAERSRCDTHKCASRAPWVNSRRGHVARSRDRDEGDRTSRRVPATDTAVLHRALSRPRHQDVTDRRFLEDGARTVRSTTMRPDDGGPPILESRPYNDATQRHR